MIWFDYICNRHCNKNNALNKDNPLNRTTIHLNRIYEKYYDKNVSNNDNSRGTRFYDLTFPRSLLCRFYHAISSCMLDFTFVFVILELILTRRNTLLYKKESIKWHHPDPLLLYFTTWICNSMFTICDEKIVRSSKGPIRCSSWSWTSLFL